MPQLTKKAFFQARELIFEFQKESCLLPIEISTILNQGAAIAYQRLEQLGREVVLYSAPRPRPGVVGRRKTRK
jgi:hypothetical protein